MKNVKWLFVGMLFLVVSFVLAGCSGGGGSSSPPPTYSISGTVTGSSVQGVTITLSSGATSLATTTTGTSGAYIFNGVANGTYTVTPGKSGSAFTPLNRSVIVSGSNMTADFIASVATTHSISGTVTVSGAALSGVTVNLTGGNTGSVTTNASGAYSFAGLVDGSYTVTPAKSGYTFSPTSAALTISGADVTTGGNFTATAVPTTFAISGTVSGAIQQGVLITLSGTAAATTTTDSSGNYSFASKPNGTYTITPSLTGYTFSPANYTGVVVNGADVTGKNFTATALTYSISGAVSGATTAGVTMTLTGAAGATITTDSSGNYTFSGLSNGNYTVTPGLTGYSFNPTSTAVTISNANQTGKNFVSSVVTAPTYSISGSVSLSGGGALPGATVTLSVGANGTTTTDATGAYTFTNLVAGSYTVTPGLPGYTIAPANVTITNANVTQNFSAASTVAGYSVSGTVNYSGSKTGKTGVYVMWSGGGTTGLGTTLSGTSGTGSYTIRGLQNGTYVVFAGMDTVGNGIPNVADPTGSSTSFTINNGSVTGKNVTMTDPTLPTPSVPANLGVFPMNTGAIVTWDTVQCPPNPFNSCDGATAYKIYSSTTLNGTYSLVATVPETDNGVYFQTGLANSSTYYYKISSLIGATESAQSTAFGPVTIGVPTGGVSVSGAITFSGSAAGHTMFIGLYGNGGIYGTTVVNPTSPQAYTISGVQPGSYNLFAFVDLDNSKYFNTGDIVPNFDFLPTVTVSSSNITSQNLTLPSGNASAAIRTIHQHNPSWTPVDQYVVEPNIYGLLKMPMKVTIMSGLNIPLPYDMAVTRPQSSGSWITVGSALPAAGNAYTYQVTYSDGTTETFTPAVTGVLTSSNMATPATPANNATGVGLTPTFTWTAPATPLTGYFYDEVGVQPTSGGNWIWNYPNSGKTGIPSSQTSVLYNADGSASQSSLTSATSYQWWISTSDSNGNLGQNYATFTTQ